MGTDGVLERLNAAAELPEVLDAAANAFATMLAAVHGYHDGGGPFYAALIMAAVPAADGRHAIVSAPSLSPAAASRAFQRTPDHRWAGRDVSAAITELAAAAEVRLLYAATIATDRRDAAACREGAASARQVREMLAGST